MEVVGGRDRDPGLEGVAESLAGVDAGRSHDGFAAPRVTCDSNRAQVDVPVEEAGVAVRLAHDPEVGQDRPCSRFDERADGRVDAQCDEAVARKVIEQVVVAQV
jgi:hypothetical protein